MLLTEDKRDNSLRAVKFYKANGLPARRGVFFLARKRSSGNNLLETLLELHLFLFLPLKGTFVSFIFSSHLAVNSHRFPKHAFAGCG